MARRSSRKAPTPQWAKTLVDRIVKDEGMPTAPRIEWARAMRHVRSWETSPDRREYWMSSRAMRDIWTRGHTWFGPANLISIVAGTDRRDARITLLHEMAHWLTQEKHNARMYATLFSLVNRFGKPGDMTEARKREKGYKPRASKSGYRLYLRERRQARSTG